MMHSLTFRRRHDLPVGRAARLVSFLVVTALLALAMPPAAVHATTFTPASTSDLIAAIVTANSNGVDDIIDLGGGTFMLTTADNVGASGGSNGLPVIGVDGGHTLTIRNGTILRNSAAEFRIIEVVSGAALSLETVTLTGGKLTASRGGGIINSGTVTVANSTLSGNTASNGGGISNQSGASLVVSDSTFTTNTAGGVGGGGIINFGTLTVTNSTFSGNTAAINGGGINVQPSATTTLTNVTMTGNTSNGLGGALSNLGTMTIIQSTLQGNHGSAGAGIATGSLTVTMRASILANGAGGGNCSPTGGVIPSHGSNIADDSTCFTSGGTDQVVADARLGPLANNGGPTQTQVLLDGSPAIDAVQGPCTSDGTGGGTVITADQRGVARPKDGNGDGTAICDVGAFERAPGALQFSNPTYSVSEAGGSAAITISRTGGSEGTVGATVSETDGSAVAPGDYTNGPLAVSFADGDTASKTVNLPITNDAIFETDETVNLALGSATGGASLGAQVAAVLTIQDDDMATPTPTSTSTVTPTATVTSTPTLTPTPTGTLTPTATATNASDAAALWIYDLSVGEGDGGPTSMTFTVDLNRVTTAPVTVQYATADGSATVADGDYQAVSGTLTFNPGELTKTVTVTVNGDTRVEPDESFTLTLSNPRNASIAKGQAVGVIVNDDIRVASACSPRPPVAVTSRATGDGRLQVTLAAGTQGPTGANRLSELRFGAGTNALIDVEGQTGRSGAFTVALSGTPTSVTFFVRRATPGQATTVPLTIVDSCGEWPTLVGGGPGAF